MNKNTISIVLLVVGAVLLALGFQEYGAFGSKLSRALGGGSSDRALFLMIGGAACTVFGALGLMKK
ncbi:MAG: DUF3185 family protein [Nitrospirota bacterium]